MTQKTTTDAGAQRLIVNVTAVGSIPIQVNRLFSFLRSNTKKRCVVELPRSTGSNVENWATQTLYLKV